MTGRSEPRVVMLEPTRRAAIERLAKFVGRAGREYERSRNFDCGPGNHGNVSLLSPYNRHRLDTETHVLRTVIEAHGRRAAAKFIDEVFWRTYFKGWLEYRPSVWTSYRAELGRLIEAMSSDAALRESYNSAISGETGIECFDSWALEIANTGYLHNHARMWFASIWVYTLKLPWQLGADFFYRHLLDGDPASNTLSWRWVCGLHTRGKTYLARASNIATYTRRRFNPVNQLALAAPALCDTEEFTATAPRELPVPGNLGRCGLLITEEDCSPESLDLSTKPLCICGVVATEMRSPLPVGEHARNFAEGAVADAVQRGGSECIANTEMMSAGGEWGPLIARWATKHHLDSIVTAYAPVGPVAEELARTRHHLSDVNVRLVEIKREHDARCWPHATKGYYKLKKRIPDLLTTVDPAMGSESATA